VTVEYTLHAGEDPMTIKSRPDWEIVSAETSNCKCELRGEQGSPFLVDCTRHVLRITCAPEKTVALGDAIQQTMTSDVQHSSFVGRAVLRVGPRGAFRFLEKGKRVE
jgi:hypothetical protein